MAKIKQPKLKTCPFCGAKPTLYYNPKLGPMLGVLPMIVCGHCGATTSFAGCETSGEDTAKKYNTRAEGGSK